MNYKNVNDYFLKKKCLSGFKQVGSSFLNSIGFRFGKEKKKPIGFRVEFGKSLKPYSVPDSLVKI